MADHDIIGAVAIAISGAPFPTERSRQKACLAIRAMRQATALMVEKGADELKVYCNDPKDYADGVEQAIDVWCAMIDAALDRVPT